jgi:hypothetical protein
MLTHLTQLDHPPPRRPRRARGRRTGVPRHGELVQRGGDPVPAGIFAVWAAGDGKE